MPKLTLHPLDIEIEADEGVTIMEAAHAHGLYWPTTCGGQGICTSCACTIDEGADNLDAIGRSELKTLSGEMGADEADLARRGIRLACQARVHGDVVVTKRGVRPARRSALALD